jgi:DNA-binding NarL/FixJ family response regulator
MSAPTKIRILFADDHAIVRDGLASLFRSDPALSLVGVASDGEEAVRVAERLLPDVAILDISMPKLNGIEATKRIKDRSPGTKVLILTIHESKDFVYEILNAGASGYLVKNAEKKEILSAVRSVAAGDTFFSPNIFKIVLQGLVGEEGKTPAAHAAPEQRLTKREMEILRLIAVGMSSREIAQALSISCTTVNSHRTSLMRKLEIHKTAGLVRYAIKHSFVAPRPPGGARGVG